MTDHETLMSLLGEWVTVTNPAHGSSWSGRLLGLGSEPCVDIEDEHGRRQCLPQAFDVQPAPAPAASAGLAADSQQQDDGEAGGEHAHDFRPFGGSVRCTFLGCTAKPVEPALSGERAARRLKGRIVSVTQADALLADPGEVDAAIAAAELDDRVTELTPAEYRAAVRRALAEIGLTYSELEAQARDHGGNFTSAQAHDLWFAIGGTVTQEELDGGETGGCPGFEPGDLCVKCGDARRWHRAPAPVPAPAAEADDLREAIAAALRDAVCPGDCGKTEDECCKTRLQPVVWRHGKLDGIDGTPELIADAVLPAVAAHVAELRARIAWLEEGREGTTAQIGRMARVQADLRTRAEQAEAALARVRELLDRDQDGLCCSHVTGQIRRAIDPQETPDATA